MTNFSKMKSENVKLFNYMSQASIEKMTALIQKVTTACPQIIAVRFVGVSFEDQVPSLCFVTTDTLANDQELSIYKIISGTEKTLDFEITSYISSSKQIIEENDDGTTIWER